MPWFPEFVTAVELARSQTRATGQTDPVGQYFAALNAGDTHVLETAWLSEHGARIETVSSLSADGRAVVELLAHLASDGREEVAWPVAVAPGDVVGRYQAALEAGDAEAVVHTFRPGGYVREPIGPRAFHGGTAALRAFFTKCFSAGGGIGLQLCAVTDDGATCALEYNCVRWGSHDLAPQAGLAVCERGQDGLLAAVRLYDDIEPPTEAGRGAAPGGGTG
jgi:SnoaL-like domain